MLVELQEQKKWKALLQTDFELDDKFCDAEELRKSCRDMAIPDTLWIFFYSLFNEERTNTGG